ncbi:hypothetical protein [Streptomyces sp. NPDC059080]|uniref:hypothetical protein n=1 Tax=Streptomyces sp. NPDC059080 TaxID=3346718 RepID=UPI0036996D79
MSTFDVNSGHERPPAFVRLCGKHLILPIGSTPTNLASPYATAESYPEFIIGTDRSAGQPITFTPGRLSDHFRRRW